MPTALIESFEDIADASLGPRRKRWTRDEVRSLAEVGTVDLERLELIDGELYNTMSKGLLHMVVLHRMVELLKAMFGAERVVQEGSIEVSMDERQTNEPEPDTMVLNRSIELLTSPPCVDDLCLIVEVADTSLRFDLTTKAPLYARTGIADYWVVDAKKKRLIVHRDPRDGRYEAVISYDSAETVMPLAAPGRTFAVGRVFS